MVLTTNYATLFVNCHGTKPTFMAIEIEYKYLVNAAIWQKVTPDKSTSIKQGYILTDPLKTVRVRTKGPKGFLTIKGKAIGAARPEFEYEIPLADAEELLNNFCENIIAKMRHLVNHEGKCWEVDVFEGDNAGLIVAEIELSEENEQFAIPAWIGDDITTDFRYSNSSLSEHPFRKW